MVTEYRFHLEKYVSWEGTRKLGGFWNGDLMGSLKILRQEEIPFRLEVFCHGDVSDGFDAYQCTFEYLEFIVDYL